jgi:hypothetical protein
VPVIGGDLSGRDRDIHELQIFVAERLIVKARKLDRNDLGVTRGVRSSRQCRSSKHRTTTAQKLTPSDRITHVLAALLNYAR